jgi:cytochrome c556
MMLRNAAFAVLALAFGATAVVAQSDAIGQRKALMKANNTNGRMLSQMVRGSVPFDAAKVSAALAQFEDTAKKLPGLFPDNSKTGDTKATAKVWTDRADFDAKIALFAKAVADAKAKATSLDGLKASFGAMARTCDGCHENYRAS